MCDSSLPGLTNAILSATPNSSSSSCRSNCWASTQWSNLAFAALHLIVPPFQVPLGPLSHPCVTKTRVRIAMATRPPVCVGFPTGPGREVSETLTRRGSWLIY
eukprot:scaffold363_cov331-Pavlova_lutheri.AAC.59